MSNQPTSRAERQRQLKRQKRKQKGKKGSLLKKVISLIFILGIVGLLSGGALFAYYASTAPELDEKLLKDPLTSDFVDANGNLIMKFGAEKREYVEYKDIPEVMENAILATEDVRFFEHGGIDFYRLGGAVIANFRDGFGSQGASTLTQQVIKNSFSWKDKTLKRKAQEAWLAHKLEQKYSKEKIFEMYFNKILMGGSIYGFGTGAEFYFDKPLNELELHEAALLAGLPQSPNAYNPFQHPERAEKRRNIVLLLMEKHGKITKEQMEAAQAIPVESTLAQRDTTTVGGQYAAYIDTVLHELEEQGLMDVLAEGVTIHTALQPEVQKTVENAINQDQLYESDEMEAGMTVLDTKTGAIVAVGGGRNYSGRNFNFATKENGQPGSVIKPILSYGPAIEKFGWSTGQALKDERYFYKGTDKEVRNVDGKHLGTLTLRDALAKSRNVPAVKVFEEVGATDAANFARKLGLPFEDVHAANALGGGEYNFSTKQIAGAYAAFGNGGIYTEPHAVKRIVFRDGTERVLTPNHEQVMQSSTAYMITDVLRDVLTRGTGTLANISGVDVAGKTGTTNYPAEILKKHNMESHYVPDTWFAGYSADYTIAIWGGYKNYTDPIKTYDRGRQVPQNLFRNVMSSISQNTPRMKKPSTVTEADIVYGSNPIVLASAATPANLRSRELFVNGSVPVVEDETEEVSLASPSNLTASLEDDSYDIILNWDFALHEDDTNDEEVTFEVSYTIDSGSPVLITTTTERQAVLPNVSLGHEYHFSVVAKRGDETSSPATTSLILEGEIIEEPSVEEPEAPDVPGEEEEPVEPNQPEIPDNNNQGQNNNPSTPNDKPTNPNDNQGNKPVIPPEQPKPKPEPTPPDKPQPPVEQTPETPPGDA